LTEPVTAPPHAPSWLDATLVYARPRMLSMLALGFSSGLPFMLIYNTLSAWLRQSGIERATISTLSLVGLAYSAKFLWSPIVDRVRLPLIGRVLGQRRSWMLLAQICVAAALLTISISEPAGDLRRLVIVTFALAFSAATQDIAIDAWRIETATLTEQGPMAAAYQFGYRLAILVSTGGALWIAADKGWHQSYATMAALLGVGIATTLLVREPERRAPLQSVLTERRVVEWLKHRRHWPERMQRAGAWFLGAVICPVLDFFARYGWQLGLLLFAFISTYRLTDYTMGVMSNPFYIDMHYSLKQVAAIVKFYGTVLSIVGVIAGGAAIMHWGRVRALLLGSALVMISNISYSILASRGVPSELGLATIISLDNFAQGVHGTALIAFMSSLTSASYTATQYALLSSLYTLPPKLLMSRSGQVVTAIGYPSFYLYTAALSIPALLLLLVLLFRRDFRRITSEADANSAAARAIEA
jgi:PAT family beta-lactamase induction signal transducer AmpG